MKAVKVKLLHPRARVPTRATSGSVGWDVYASESKVIPPLAAAKVSCGFAMEIPPGWECQVRPRSSIYKTDLFIPNSPGTIDSDYRGEVCLLLRNLNPYRPVTVRTDKALAQLVFKHAPVIGLVVVEELSETERGAGGFGSTDGCV